MFVSCNYFYFNIFLEQVQVYWLLRVDAAFGEMILAYIP